MVDAEFFLSPLFLTKISRDQDTKNMQKQDLIVSGHFI